MRTHPVFLRLEGRSCLVVGGDGPAARKAAACAQKGARVTVVAAGPGPEMEALVMSGAVRLEAREFHSGDLAGVFLAYVSTRDRRLIRRIAAEAERERVLLNVIDVPEACTFVSPAVVERGDLQVAIGTGGASPGLAARLRREIDARLGPEYAGYVAILGAVRRALAGSPDGAGAQAEVITRLLDSPLLDLVRAGRYADIDALLARIAGGGVTLERLGVALGEAA